MDSFDKGLSKPVDEDAEMNQVQGDPMHPSYPSISSLNPWDLPYRHFLREKASAQRGVGDLMTSDTGASSDDHEEPMPSEVSQPLGGPDNDLQPMDVSQSDVTNDSIVGASEGSSSVVYPVLADDAPEVSNRVGDTATEISNAGQTADLDPTMPCGPQNDSGGKEDSVQYSRALLDFQIKKVFEKFSMTYPKYSLSSTTGGKRFGKAVYCLYCKGKFTSKISRHYLNIHAREKAVADIMQLAPGSVERKRRLAVLQHEGNHLHNLEVLRSGCGELVVQKRPRTCERFGTYLPCTKCKAWLCSQNISQHYKACPAGEVDDPDAEMKSRMMLFPYLDQNDGDADIDDLMCRMKETAKHPGLKATCHSDVLIREFCRDLLQAMRTAEKSYRETDYISTRVRAVGRLLISLNEASEKCLDLAAYISPKYFQLVVTVVKKMGDSVSYLPQQLGQCIKQLCQLKHSLALQAKNNQEKEEAEDFDLLYRAHWKHAVNHPREELQELSKSTELPKTDDIFTLKTYLDEKLINFLTKRRPTQQQWTEAAQVLMVAIFLFNNRCVGEVQNLKVSDVLDMEADSNEEILSQMGVTEKALAGRVHVVEVRGESTIRLRKVFVLLSHEMLDACKHLISKRPYCGISPSNEYLFARTVLDGHRAIREVSHACPGLEYPKLISTRLFHKYLATTIQLLDMTGDELKIVADHLGHSVTVHVDLYRLQTSILEKTKVARALIALENGQLTKFIGCNLSSCTFEELPIPTSTNEDKDDDGAGLPSSTPTSGEGGDESGLQTFIKGLTHEDSTKNRRTWHTRKRWSKKEMACINEEFGRHITLKKNPSFKEIRRAQEKHPCLTERNEFVIKAKVNNIILGKCKANI